ncbi:hypothetical protein FH972_024309 [Carpinus fangiana]|uniref:AB hydrolase-1 domain-containing protein n=1 Tax=Carpinus fangiana TaxID=176857 RepID=A0A5N6KXP2_9ROSI|nr:hypothetical protein FH972_024309 [Carpinus fangiana]
MIGTSLAEYGFIRACIWGVRSILPLSCTYLAARVFFKVPRPFRLLDYYTAAEVLFYVLVFVPVQFSAQRPARHPALPGLKERQVLFERCFSNIDDHAAFLQKWFKDAPLDEIKRENVREYLSWAFFNVADAGPEHDDEMDVYLKTVDTSLGKPLPPGRGNASCLRLTLDPVPMLHRPLIWYLGAVLPVDSFVHVSLSLRGFTFYRPSSFISLLTTFPPRPLALFTRHTSPSSTLSYWFHPHTSKTHLPVLFLHGIGIGPMPYVPFLCDINAGRPADDQIGIIAIEILPVSFRLVAPVLRKNEFVKHILAILAHHRFSHYVLASHSYGSVITTHLLKNPASAPAVAAVVLIDPVSIMLHMPAVAYNFMYRRPRGANEWQLYYFASTDPCVAHTLGRSFFWSENILWKQDVVGKPLTVALAGQDLIVDTRCVAGYLTDGVWRGGYGDLGSSHAVGAVETWEQRDTKILWSDNLDHAQVLDVKGNRSVLVAEVLRRSKDGAVAVFAGGSSQSNYGTLN